MADRAPRYRFSLIIPAYNEELFLPALLDSVDIAMQSYKKGPAGIEVIVVDNTSADNTAQIALSRGCRLVTEKKRIIAAVRNAGARVAQGEILAFVDADSVIHPQTFNAIDRCLKNGGVIAGATGVKAPYLTPGLIMTYVFMMPMVWLTGMDTGVVFCRQRDFLSFGGYNEARLFAEDVEFLLRLRNLGKSIGEKLVRLKGVKAIFSMRKFEQFGQWHYLGMIFRVVWAVLFRKGNMKAFADRYWYGSQRLP